MNSGALGRFAAAITVMLLALVWGSRLTFLLLSNPGPQSLFVLLPISVLLAAAVWFLLRKHRLLDQEDRVPRYVWLQCLGAPVVASMMLVIGWVRSGGYPIWAMTGDMIWNTWQSLFLHANGGVGLGENSNPAPLTNVLFALGYGVVPEPSLGHIFQTHGWVLLVIGALASFLSGYYTAMRAQGMNIFVGSFLAFTVGWLPYTGVTFFQISEAGHANIFASICCFGWLFFFIPKGLWL